MYKYHVQFYGPELRTFDIKKGDLRPKPLLIGEIIASSKTEAQDKAQLHGLNTPGVAHYIITHCQPHPI